MAQALANLQEVERIRSYETQLRNGRALDSSVKNMNKNVAVDSYDKTESMQISQKIGEEDEMHSSIKTRPEKRQRREEAVQDNLQKQSNDETVTRDQQNKEQERGTERKGRDVRFRLEQFYNRQRMKQQQFQAQQHQRDEELQEEQESTQQKQQPLASYFHLYPLVEKLAYAVETGTQDQSSNALVTELSSYFNKSQQMLNSVSGALGSKPTYVDGQKRKIEDTEKLLQQRRGLIVEYRKSIEDILKIDS